MAPISWTGLGCYKEDGPAQNQALSVPLIIQFLWLQELYSLCGAIGGGHGYRRRITMPPLGSLGNKRMASGGMRYPTGPVKNTWAGGEPLISSEGKYFVGTGRDSSNLQ